jgi:hypothetical protein
MRFPAMLPGVLLFVLLAACKPFVHTDDPEPYLGGEAGNISFRIVGPGVVKILRTENFNDEDGFYVDRRLWNGNCESRILQAYPDQVCINDIFATQTQVLTTHPY